MVAREASMISVIVTNYNYEQYLARCLRSLTEQTLSAEEYEVILVDDGSQDQSLMVAQAFSNRVRIISCLENKGLATASNIGFSSAQGRYLVRVDSDDFVHPEFLRFLLRYMELRSKECDAVAVNYIEVDELGNALAEVNASSIPIACGVAFKSEVMLNLGLYRNGLRIGEDVDFMQKFNSAGYVLDHLNLPLYRYTKHNKSLTAAVRIV